MRSYLKPRIGFFKRFYYSFASPSFYVQIIKEPLSKAIRYSILLTAIVSLFISIFLSFEVRQTFANIREFISNPAFPDIVIQSGTLVVTEENNLDITLGKNGEFRAILESDKEKNYTDLKNYTTGLFISPNFITFQSRNSAPILIRLNTFGSLTIGKDDFLLMLRFSEYLSYFFLLIFYFAQLCVQYFFKSLIVYFTTAWLFSGYIGKELEIKSRQVFLIVLYAMSLGTILQELFYLMRPSDQSTIAIFILVLYMMTIRIVRCGMTAILQDKVDGIDEDTFDDFFF